jgi:hypothetical protein
MQNLHRVYRALADFGDPVLILFFLATKDV